MNHCLSPTDIHQWLTGNIAPAVADSFTAHLHDCPTCRSHVDQLSDHIQMIEDEAGRPSVADALDVIAAAKKRMADEEASDDSVGLVLDPEANDQLAALYGLDANWAMQETRLDHAGGEAATVHTRVGRFQIERELGSGGFGTVYLAEDPLLLRVVALKVPRSKLDAKTKERFVHESQVSARLHHPHIVPVYEAGEADGVCYLAAAYCKGPTLEQWCKLQKGDISPILAARIVKALADAAEHAHANGIVHRDIKPKNVMFDSTIPFHGLPFSPRLTDFGLAKSLVDENGHTSTGFALGTPRYMAPEQIVGRSDQLQPACDVYALGVVLYELLTGQSPYDESEQVAVFKEILESEPPALHCVIPDIPRDLEAVCLKCLEKSPDRRYARGADLSADLERFLDGRPTLARPLRTWERIVRWARRAPALAALVATILLGVALLTGGLFLHGRQLRHLNDQLADSNRELSVAIGLAEDNATRATRSERQMQELLYVSDMRLAALAWREGDPREATKLLERHRPQPGHFDYRGFEWHLLRNQTSYQGTTVAQTDRAVYFLTVSPDGSRLASCGADAVIRLYDPVTWTEMQSFPTGQTEVNAVVFSPSGDRLATAGDDGTVMVWDAASGERLRTIRAHQNLAYNVQFLDENRLASCGSRDVYVRIWNADTGESIAALEGDREQIEALAVSPDGRWLGSVGKGGWASVWHTDSLEQAHQWTQAARIVTSNHQLFALAFSPDSQFLATGGTQEQICFWNLSNGEFQETVQQSGRIQVLNYAPDGKSLVCGIRAGLVHWWALEGHGAMAAARFVGHQGRVYCMAHLPDGRLVTAGERGELIVWPSAGELPSRCFYAEGIEPFDGQPFWVVQRTQQFDLFDARTGERRQILGDESWPVPLAFSVSPEGQSLVLRTEHPESIIECWDLRTQQRRFRLPLHRPGGPMAVSGDGRLFAVGLFGTDAELLFVDSATGEIVSRRAMSTDSRVDFSPDDQHYAITIDYELIVLDRDHRPLWTGRLPTSGCRACVYSPDGRIIATGGDERLIRFWNAETGQLQRVVAGHTAPIFALAFSPDGRSLVSGADDGTVKIWQVSTGQHLFDLRRDQGYYHQLRFAPDGARLGGVDNRTRQAFLFDIHPPES